ncbi:molybdopterin cofactor-binding domain-containing protein [Burkholderia sp. Se-20378]|uniref:xanthine dehydrogenase family protein molybdopterin-binding subunit n=1 Tax=Burkholderia sp. Se-20378 TaxID=2703899 RepID=UPI0019823190|nr:molybdopterin cofactor-binding domain-containing protein [Burkholderia sp. Se-20378]MBN3768074.1 xanthine dehydrogenase family protein molybdopterin-binding subunit [Burkholderia sp. Se-20378]
MSATETHDNAPAPKRGRRRFLLGALGVTGGLVVGWGCLPPRSRLGDPTNFPGGDGTIALNGWVKLSHDGTVTVALPRVEMGQGIQTAFSMLVAEELGVPLQAVRTQNVTTERIYGNVAGLADGLLPIHPDDADAPWARTARWLLAKTARELGLIITGASSSVADAWQPLREAAASARSMLVEAAGRNWRVDPSGIAIRDGVVVGPGTLRQPIGDLVGSRTPLRPPESAVRLKDPATYTLLGHAAPRVDVPSKVDGSAKFGLDVRPPRLCYAAVALCPTLGGTLRSVDAAAVMAMPGIIAVAPFDGGAANFGGSAGVAVIAEHYWQARRALERLQPVWNEQADSSLGSADIDARLSAALNGDASGFRYRSLGDAQAVLAAASPDSVLDAVYTVPYLAHAPMEPINCTAQVHDGKVRLWAPTQTATLARMAAARAANVDASAVEIDVPLIGGGFGRRLESDFVAQAVQVARHAQGRPVQVIWSREDDIRHDFYRPRIHARLRAHVVDGHCDAIASRSAGQSIIGQELTRILGFPGIGFDRCVAEGLFDMPYEIANQHVEHVNVALPVPVGFWRSVGHSYNAFFLETFVDEIAAKSGRDPVALRRAWLTRHPRYLKVLDTAMTAAGLKQPESAEGSRAWGCALHASFGSIVAMAADVSIRDGSVNVHRIVCAIDCGYVINPDIVRQQVEGGIVFGLSAALHGRVTFERGRVEQSNFTDYRILEMRNMPQVDISIVPSAAAPSGVGEVSVPPVAPAVANAIFRITRRPQRSLPLSDVPT